MTNPPRFDEKAARRVEAVYTTPDVAGQRALLLERLALRPGERVLDVGVGPGFLTRDMAEIVGSGGAVRGMDMSESMLALAEARCADLPHVDLQTADAVNLPYEDSAFDAAVSSQVYEYVVDLDAALAELFRVLRPGGRAAILDTDWGSLVWHAEDEARAQRVLAAWDGHLADSHLPRTLAPRLQAAGFEDVRVEAVPLLNDRYAEDTYSHGMISVIVPFVIRHRGIEKEEAKAWAEDLRRLGERGAYFFSLNRYLFSIRKPEA